MNRRPVRLVAIALAAVLGVVTGLWCEQLTGVRQGVDTRISSLTVMPDDRTIVVMAGGHDRVSAVETPTEVRITRHTTWEPFTACFEACDDTSLAVHLHAPLGGRSIVDTSDGASMPPAAQRILRPSAIPTGLVTNTTWAHSITDRAQRSAGHMSMLHVPHLVDRDQGRSDDRVATPERDHPRLPRLHRCPRSHLVRPRCVNHDRYRGGWREHRRPGDDADNDREQPHLSLVALRPLQPPSVPLRGEFT